MKIGGFQKTSLLDYPNYVSSIIWTVGCNLHCPFCYNKDLVDGNVEKIPENHILDFLKKRKKMLDGIVITGGEPFLQKDISDFILKVKKHDLLVKVDTNGTFPDKLKDLIDGKLVDYVAMDVKAPKEKYEILAGKKVNISNIEKSVDILKNSNIDYEFRTTIIPGFLDKKDIIDISKWLNKSKNYYIQQFKSNVSLISEKLQGQKPYSKEELLSISDEIKDCFDVCDVRYG